METSVPLPSQSKADLHPQIRKNCAIGLYSWSKWQIAFCDIKMNSEIYVVGLIYKSFSEVKFCWKNLTYFVRCYVSANKMMICGILNKNKNIKNYIYIYI
jgi:hypothetical protein